MGLVRVLRKELSTSDFIAQDVRDELPPHWRAVQTVLHLPLRMFAICSLDRPRLAHTTFLCSERAPEHFVEVEFG